MAAAPSQDFGAAQPPRFSAGSLISDGDLPDWLRESADAQRQPQPPQQPQPQQPQQPPWAAPPAAPPAQAFGASMGAPSQNWQRPESFQPDIASQHTVRQQAVGTSGPAPQFPFGQQPGYPPQQVAPPPYPPAYPQQQPGYPPQQQSGYPQQPATPMGYPPQQGYPQQGYPQQGPGYGQAAPASYGAYPAYPQMPQMPQMPQTPPAPVNAFPSIEQAGAAYSGPQVGGMAGHALLDQRALPDWLANGHGQAGASQIPQRAPTPSGMQARSLVDDQALPKWLRDQPESAGSATVSDWIGASAAQEPMPPFLSAAYADAQVPRAPQPQPQPQPAQPWGAASPIGAGDSALPDWLRAQAEAHAPGDAAAQSRVMAAPAAAPEHAGGFAASDLIDPSALPDWVTRRAPAPQTFSSTHGWSAANPAPDTPYGASDQGYAASAGGGYESGGYESGGYDGGAYGGGGYDGSASMEAMNAHAPWGDEPWDASAQLASAYSESIGAESRNGHGAPLAPEELPPWLRGVGGAHASGEPALRARGNPWAAASEPAELDGWDDADSWSEHSARPDQGWNDSPAWNNGRGAGQVDDRRYAEQGEDWSEQRQSSDGWGAERPRRPQRSQDDWDEPARRRGGERRNAEPARGGRGYDERRDAYDYEVDANEEEEEADGQRGRGWLGFLRRDRR